MRVRVRVRVRVRAHRLCGRTRTNSWLLVRALRTYNAPDDQGNHCHVHTKRQGGLLRPAYRAYLHRRAVRSCLLLCCLMPDA